MAHAPTIPVELTAPDWVVVYDGTAYRCYMPGSALPHRPEPESPAEE